MEDHTLAVTALFLRTEQTVLTAHFKIASLNTKEMENESQNICDLSSKSI